MFRFFRDAIRSTPLALAPCEATLLYFIATSRATERGVLKNSGHSTKCSNARFPTGCTRSFLSREMKSRGAFSSKGWRKRRRRRRRYIRTVLTKRHRAKRAPCTARAHRLKIANFFSRRITRCIKLSSDVNFGETFGALAPSSSSNYVRCSPSEVKQVRIDLKFLQHFYNVCSAPWSCA